MKKEYDVFVSYKTRKYASEARAIVKKLDKLRYRVWFDESVLGSKDPSLERYSKDDLIRLLTYAVKRGTLKRCVKREAVLYPF